jgi:ribose transport system permease protein
MTTTRDTVISGFAQRAFLTELPGVTWILGALILTFSVLGSGFLSVTNLTNVSLQSALLLMVALPMTLVILTEGLDLSVGALLGLCGVILAQLLLSGWSIPVAIAAVAMLGFLFGALNGVLVGVVGLPAFVVTLGTLGIAEGSALLLSDGNAVGGFDPLVEAFYHSRVAGLPTPVLVAAGLYALLHGLLYSTRFGNYVFGVGGNKEALRLAAVRSDLVHVGVYVLCSVVVALSAFLLIGRMNSAHPTVSLGMEFDAIAAVVLGGTSFERGRGWLFGTVLGVLAIAVLRNGLNVLSVGSSMQVVSVGLLVIVALLLDRRRN